MTHSFLHETAAYILRNHGKDLQNIAVFLPNQTGINFFRKALAQTANSAVWAPLCITPSKQMERTSGLVVGHKIKLAAELHRVYQHIFQREMEPFERFFPWADLLLDDFDDIDKYLADAKVLYANLAGLKEINEQFAFLTEEQILLIRRFWRSYEEPSITKSKESFLRIWEKLYDVYELFHKILLEKQIGYEGLLQRKAIENPTTLFAGLEDITHAYVIGFNRLNGCEKKFFQELRKKYNTEFFYDVHPFTVADKMHEAGKFYRETTFFFPPKFHEEELTITKPTIDVVSVSGSNTAVKYAATEIKKALDGHRNPEEILVMMPDEKQLIPLLYSLPDSLEAINITAGLALGETPLLSMLRVLYNLRKMATERPAGIYFRVGDVVKALQHPYLNFGVENINAQIIKDLKDQRRVRPERNLLTREHLHKLMFSLNRELPFHEAVTRILRLLLVTEDLPIFEKRILQTATEAAAGVSDIIRSENLPSDDKASFILLNNVLRSARIPFEGEPVVGMQIMGPLETRNLDFKTVIIPAMGDDLFPGAGNSKTYIPFALRRAFGLPLPEDRAAELSHIFFRLLQRAEKVVLVTNTSAGPMSTGEPSRFILRLEADPYYAPLLHKKSVLEKVQFKEPLEINIHKTGKVLDRLHQFTDDEKQSMFPTAINTYIDCSLRFYFRHIAGVKESHELNDVADHADFGNIFHKIMEWIYADYVSRRVTKDDVENLRESFDALSLRAFKEHFGYGEDEPFDFEGESLIQREVIRKYVNRVLDLDAAYAPFHIVGLELGEFPELLRMPLQFVTPEGVKTVHVAGKIDRVDEKDGIIRILDYKTGADDLKYVSIPALFDSEANARNKAALQTWLYGLIYAQNFPAYSQIQAGVISVRNIFEPGFDPILKEKLDPEKKMSAYVGVQNLYDKKDDFLGEMSTLFTEMYDVSLPFSQTDKWEKCLTCPYREICRR